MAGLRSLFSAMLGGVVAALFFLAYQRGGLGGAILVSMASLPLFLVGLGLGTAFTGLASVIALGIVAKLAGPIPASWFLAGIVVPAIVLVPVAMLAPGSRETGGKIELKALLGGEVRLGLGEDTGLDRRSARVGGLLVVVLALLGVAMFGLLMLLAQQQPGGLPRVSEQAVTDALSRVGKMLPPDQPDMAAVLKQVPIHETARLLPGILVVSVLIQAALNAILAQGALAAFGWNSRAGPALSRIVLPRWTSILFAAALAAAVFGTRWGDGLVGFAGINLTIVTSLPLVFGGLAVLHSFAARSPAPIVFLVAAYTVAAILGPMLGWPIMLIAALGLVDQYADLRRRIAAGTRRGDK